MNQGDVEKKQELLKTEILDKGYDPFSFQSFCEHNKGEESDIETWSYEEILRLVKLYQETNPLQVNSKRSSSGESNKSDKFDFDFSSNFAADFTQASNNFTVDFPQTNQNFTADFQQLQQLPMQPPDQLQQEDKQDDIVEIVPSFESDSHMHLKYQCQRLEPGILSKTKGVSIQICGFETVSGSLLSASYTAYVIQCKPMDWEVKRRFTDFIWLRATLQKMYPGILVPMLSEKTIQKSTSSIQKRKSALEMFLKELLKSPEFRNSKFFVDFLSAPDKQFKKITSDSNKIKRPTEFQHFINMNGQIWLKLDSKIRQQQTNFDALLNYQEPLYEKQPKSAQIRIKINLKQLQTDFTTLSKRLQELGELFVQLQKISEKYDFTDKYRALQSHDVYKMMKTFAQCQADEANSKAQHIIDKMMPFFRFHKMNFNSFKEVQKTRNLIALEVEKRKEIKEETFLEDLMKSFEHKQKSSKEGLEIPSKNVDLLRQQYAFFNWKIEDEAIKYQNRLVLSFVNEFGQYARLFGDLQRKSCDSLDALQRDFAYLESMNLQNKTAELQRIVDSY